MKLDSHSESLLTQVHPVLAERVRKVVTSLAPHDVRVISGLRTYAEQDALYKKRPMVTKAKGGQSNHNFGLACDLGVFDGGKYLQESPVYDLIQGAAHKADLESGTDWKQIKDRPHVQIHSDLIVNGSPTNACRALFAKGGLPAIFAHVTAYLNSAASISNSADAISQPATSPAGDPSAPPT